MLKNKQGKQKYYRDTILKDEYGDLLVWKQILDKAKTEEVDIIFITDDSKGDWWNITSGRTIGPRYELINEFSFETQKKLVMYNTQRFMKYASSFLESELSDTTKKELKELADSIEFVSAEEYSKNFRKFLESVREIPENDIPDRQSYQDYATDYLNDYENAFLSTYVIDSLHRKLLMHTSGNYYMSKQSVRILIKLELVKFWGEVIVKENMFNGKNLVEAAISILLDRSLIIDYDENRYVVISDHV